MKKGNPDVLSESDYTLLNEVVVLYSQLLALTGPEPSIYDGFGIVPVPDEEYSKTPDNFKKAAIERKNNFLGSTDKVITVKK